MSTKQTLSGLFWNGTESFLLQVIKLGVNLVLARQLSPVDFGLIALLAVFIQLVDVVATGGFRSTIIMRPKLADIDFSTAFIYNIAVAAFLYGALFFCAPLIASFYSEPKLVVLIRVLGLVNLLHAGYFVQDALLQRNLSFKLLAKRNIMAAIISGCVAIAMAHFGLGVWSLIGLTVSRAVAINIYLWANSIWKLSVKFSFESFKKNFNFGSKMMLSVILGVVFNNLNNLLIGKYYSKSVLGYYYQARRLKDVPIESARSILTKTSVPLIARYQEDTRLFHQTYFNIMRIAATGIFPIVALLFVLSQDLFLVLFTSKWMASIPLFRIMIIAGIFTPFIVINGQSPAIMGDSKFYLRIDIVYKLVILLVSIIALQFGLLVFIASQTVLAGAQMVANLFIARKYFKVSVRSQLMTIMPYLAYSVAAGGIAYLVRLIPGLKPWLRLAFGTTLFCLSYAGMLYLFEPQAYRQVIQLIGSWIQTIRVRIHSGQKPKVKQKSD